MLSSFKSTANNGQANGGGYLNYLFDKPTEEEAVAQQADVMKTKIDVNKLRADVSTTTRTKATLNKVKKYPYVYGPRLPQLDPKHLYHLDDVTSEDDDLTLIGHPNQPTVPASIAKREKRQTKDSTKIKGKLQKLNSKQDALINKTKTYNDVYDPESEQKVTKEITNPITKPVYKFIGRIKNDADLKKGKKTKYLASQPKTPIWNRFKSSSSAEPENKEEEANDEEGPSTLDPRVVGSAASEKEGEDEEGSVTEAKQDSVEEDAAPLDPSIQELSLSKTRTAEEVEKDIEENEEGPIPLDPAIHELSLNKTRTAEETEKDIEENEEGPIPLDPAIHELSLNKTRTAEEVGKDIEENLAGVDGPEDEKVFDDVESKISYNPIFFVDKKNNKLIQKTFETPLQAIVSKTKNLEAFSSKKKQQNSETFTSLEELKLKQEEDTEKLSILMDEVIDLQEKCQPLHFKKLDELERLNALSKFHHKVDLYKHEQEKLQTGKKEFEKLQRHQARDINRSERTNIRKQRVLQKEARDLKKVELRDMRRHHRKLTHFEEMKKKFITDVPSQNFATVDEANDADDEAEVGMSSAVETDALNDAAPIEIVSTSADDTKDEPKSVLDAESEEPKDEEYITKEYVEPDTQSEYENKIKEIGQEFSYISKEPLISCEEEKELTELKESLNTKKEEINILVNSLNDITVDMNTKLSLISEFKPPADSKVASPSLEDLKAPTLSSVVPVIEKDFGALTDNEFLLSQPSDISETLEYVPKTSSDESALSTLQISSSDIGPETDSESEGESNDHVPVGYKGVLPKRGFLRSVTYTAATAAALRNATVPTAYDKWVINEGDAPDEIPVGFKGVLPQRMKLSSIPYDSGNAEHLATAALPSVYDKWVINEGDAPDEVPVGFMGVLPQRMKLSSIPYDSGNAEHLATATLPDKYNKWVINEGNGPDEIPTGFRGILPQRKYLSSVPYDIGNAKYLGTEKVPDVYSKWEPKEGDGIDNIPKGFNNVLPKRYLLATGDFDATSASALATATVPKGYSKWTVKPIVSNGKNGVLNNNKSLLSDAALNKKTADATDSDVYSTYTEEEVITVSSDYNLGGKIL